MKYGKRKKLLCSHFLAPASHQKKKSSENQMILPAEKNFQKNVFTLFGVPFPVFWPLDGFSITTLAHSVPEWGLCGRIEFQRLKLENSKMKSILCFLIVFALVSMEMFAKSIFSIGMRKLRHFINFLANTTPFYSLLNDQFFKWNKFYF